MKKPSVLDQFYKVAELIMQCPLQLWPEDTQKQIITYAKQATNALEKDLQKMPRLNRPAGMLKQINNIKKALDNITDNELNFLQALCDMIDVYKKKRIYGEHDERMNEIEIFVTSTKKQTAEYFFHIDRLNELKKDLTEQEQQQQDLKTIQDVGIFFVIEYTLQVLYEFTELSDTDKYKLLHQGLHTKAGNLPSYISTKESMRETLCYRIYDDQLRKELLLAHFVLEQTMLTKDLNKIFTELIKFHIAVLTLFKNKGLRTYEGRIYAPFGNNVPLDDIIEKIKKLNAA